MILKNQIQMIYQIMNKRIVSELSFFCFPLGLSRYPVSNKFSVKELTFLWGKIEL